LCKGILEVQKMLKRYEESLKGWEMVLPTMKKILKKLYPY